VSLNAGTLTQIQRVCREHTENRDETDAKIDEKNDERDGSLVRAYCNAGIEATNHSVNNSKGGFL
jgi:hypothetical protein